MNFYTKAKFRNFLKEKWSWFLGSGIFLTATAVITIIGFSISGWNIVVWIHSQWAVSTFICLAGLIYFLIMLFVLWKKYEVFKK